jgi:hypothetical protein
MIELLLQAEGALSVGLLDRAETLYRQVATADPRNSIAVVGLARVALERSDEVAALTLARRALLIDPDNDAARRMAGRLEEVLRHRGVAVAPPDAGEVAAAPADAGEGAAAGRIAAAGTVVPAGAERSPEPRRRRRSYLARLLHRER